MQSSEPFQLLDVLLALEKMARFPKFHSLKLDEIFTLDHWNAYRNVYKYFDPNHNAHAPHRQFLDAESTSRLIASSFEMDAIFTILDALSDAARGFHRQISELRDRIVPKLAKGIVSLPDELLTKTFKYAVYDEGRLGSRQAVWLSHVSRRFRNVALGERGLWTTLSSPSQPSSLPWSDRLAAFISRSGENANFDAFINYNSNRRWSRFAEVMHEFMDLSKATVSRWKALTVSQEPEGFMEPRAILGDIQYVLDELQNYAKRGLIFPSLEELHILGNGAEIDNPKLSWKSPNLRLLRCTDYLPCPSIMFTSVTAFSLTLELDGSFSRIEALLRFLSSMPNVSSFRFEAQFEERLEPDDSEEDRRLPEVVCPALTSFQLLLRNIVPSWDGLQESALASLFEALRMPLLENQTISIALIPPETDNSQPSQSLQLLSNALLPIPTPNSRSRLSTLSFKVTVCELQESPRYRTEYIPPGAFPASFDISIDRIPNVSSLTLSMHISTRVLFTRGDNVGGEPCCLSEVKFSGCDNMDKEDLRSTVQSLRQAEIWDGVQRIVVENCDRLEFDEIVGLVGETKLRFSRIED